MQVSLVAATTQGNAPYFKISTDYGMALWNMGAYSFEKLIGISLLLSFMLSISPNPSCIIRNTLISVAILSALRSSVRVGISSPTPCFSVKLLTPLILWPSMSTSVKTPSSPSHWWISIFDVFTLLTSLGKFLRHFSLFHSFN